MGPKTTIQWLALLVAALMVCWFGAWAYLVSQEDYAPKPGSLVYYVGISSLVRNAPLVDVMGRAAYFGSVGDGNKPSQSEVSYETTNQNISNVVATFHAYLLANKFQPHAGNTDNAAALLSEGEQIVHQAEYVSAKGEIVVLMMLTSSGDPQYQIKMTHYD